MISLRAAIIIFLLWGAGLGRAAINIACVGDSITAGAGVASPTVDGYPARLQDLVGTNYVVQNDGVSGTTLLFNGDDPYERGSAYLNSHLHPMPDMVIIMLGSNDSKPQNWVYGTNFYANYLVLIASYTNLANHPRMLLCTPPPVFGNGSYDINPGIVATNISPLVRELGTNLEIQVIDMQSLLAGHPEWFPDTVHPNAQGNAVMAAIVYTALLGDTMNGSIPGLGIKTDINHNAILNWPAGGSGWVLQSATATGGTAAWSITTRPAFNDGTSVRLTNPIAGPDAWFQLWNPSIPNH